MYATEELVEVSQDMKPGVNLWSLM